MAVGRPLSSKPARSRPCFPASLGSFSVSAQLQFTGHVQGRQRVVQVVYRGQGALGAGAEWM